MFLRRNRRKVDGETYEYWTLVETVRTARGPRQRVIAHLGKAPGLDRQSHQRWEDIADLLEGREPTRQPQFFDSSPEAEPPPQWAEVDLRGLRVERVREFGVVYLALALWRRLGLHKLLEELVVPGKEQVPWDVVGCILVIARFCGNQSELEVAERWYQDSALEDLLGVPWPRIDDNRLYRGLDVLHGLKEELCRHLMKRYQSWFGVEFEFLLYDVTSTYFEGEAKGNAKAARGYSRDKRPDCKQVNIGLVVTPEGGLPIGYEVFAGNRADVTTVEEMVEMMEAKYGVARRIWVLDRGMISEENMEFLRGRNARYLVGTPKSQLRKFEREYLEEQDWAEVQSGVEVKLVAHPDGHGQEQYVLCRSVERAKKEAAILELKRSRLRNKLHEIDRSLRQRAQRLETVERRVGRWLGRYAAAERCVSVEVLQDPATGKAVGLKIEEKEAPLSWAQHAHGGYLLRTNCLEEDPTKLWRWYMQLSQAEEAFRIAKTDLNLRPVYHQKTERVEAHILVCFLTLALWRSLEMWMRGKGLGTCCRQLLKEVATVRAMDVILPVRNTGEICLRVVAKPDRPVAELLAHLGLQLPSVPKRIENVVEKISPSLS